MPLAIPWIDDVMFFMRSGESAVSGNLYAGLMEYRDMGFVLHFCREADCFIDVGGNVGTYTLIASGVTKSKTIVFEPIPATYGRLMRHISINNLDGRVTAVNSGVGSEAGTLSLTTDKNCMNRVTKDINDATIEVPVVTLDQAVTDNSVKILKIDVEGYEHAVITGAHDLITDPKTQAVIVELNGAGQDYGY